MQVFNYRPIIGGGAQTIYMPKGAKLLSVHNLAGKALTLYALVNEDNERVKRQILIVGTGEAIEVHPGQYVGTVQHTDRVVHLFDQGEI